MAIVDNEKMWLALERIAFNSKKHASILRSENLEVLELICPDLEARCFFAEFSFDTVVEIGAYCFNESNELKKEYTWDDAFKYALRHNLLLVGSTANGDLVALDLNDYQIGILFHDYFLEDEGEDPRKYLIKMDCSIGQFFMNSVSIDEYPVDAYEAAAYTGAEFTGYWSPENTE
ncbi:hypothetical protein [Hymenobacter canadensis]|uniref:SMI1/KNR4 family protein n=1 Tax=Hymenobacter canadensis TaxID=2999067 RepID=A0ABY7LS62_9BACT|nr:hypothetical protein [Hymenobacter canadensis]WBA43248.1 hypothetical protein O3303_06690 [Hymenobacter canadensis]